MSPERMEELDHMDKLLLGQEVKMPEGWTLWECSGYFAPLDTTASEQEAFLSEDPDELFGRVQFSLLVVAKTQRAAGYHLEELVEAHLPDEFSDDADELFVRPVILIEDDIARSLLGPGEDAREPSAGLLRALGARRLIERTTDGRVVHAEFYPPLEWPVFWARDAGFQQERFELAPKEFGETLVSWPEGHGN